MIFPTRRGPASVLSSRTRALLSTLAFALLTASAHAVIVRGRVTDALGNPIRGARVQLIEHGKVAAIGYAADDGTYEIRSADAGRFTLLGSAGGFLPGIGQEFYGGATDILDHDVVLSAVTVQQAISVTATAIPTPVPQLTAPVTVIPGSTLAHPRRHRRHATPVSRRFHRAERPVRRRKLTLHSRRQLHRKPRARRRHPR